MFTFAFLPFFPFFLLRQRIEFIYYLVLCLIVPKFVRFFLLFFFPNVSLYAFPESICGVYHSERFLWAALVSVILSESLVCFDNHLKNLASQFDFFFPRQNKKKGYFPLAVIPLFHWTVGRQVMWILAETFWILSRIFGRFWEVPDACLLFCSPKHLHFQKLLLILWVGIRKRFPLLSAFHH